LRFINEIFTAAVGESWSNAEVLPHYVAAVEKLSVGAEEKAQHVDAVGYFLMGERRRQAAPGWLELDGFEGRARAFEMGADRALDLLAAQVGAAARAGDVVFDAVVTTTSTGNLMPGLSYRMAARLGDRVRTDSSMIDLGNVGCTGGAKALCLVQRLAEDAANVLVVSVEQPSTLVHLGAADVDVWQGNCTFGDGAAAMWVSTNADHGKMALEVTSVRDVQRAADGLGLIRWGYDQYYTFRLADETTFNQDVRKLVGEVLGDVEADWLQTPRWAIHPAGISLLMRLSRKLGLPREAVQASATHYERWSNMSSASLLHILKDVASETRVGDGINLLTMGAGFNVIYGRLRKER